MSKRPSFRLGDVVLEEVGDLVPEVIRSRSVSKNRQQRDDRTFCLTKPSCDCNIECSCDDYCRCVDVNRSECWGVYDVPCSSDNSCD